MPEQRDRDINYKSVNLNTKDHYITCSLYVRITLVSRIVVSHAFHVLNCFIVSLELICF
jgi:hypothetical protein